MKEICINIGSSNSESIKTIQNNNNSDVYKIYILKNKRAINLTNKTVKMAYLRNETKEGNVLTLDVTNPSNGEITLKITNALTKKDGNYSCQLAIYGQDNYLEHTATFSLTVESNIFSKIAEEITDTKTFTYLEQILNDAIKASEDLKKNIPIATTLNNSLENNIRVGQPLIQEATNKNMELQNSLEETKKYIAGLDGSQNIPGIRMELTELQNGLKSNQALAYTGSSISADNTLEGRTEGMVIRGKTSIVDGQLKSFGEAEKVGEKYKISIISHGKNLFDYSKITGGEILTFNNKKCFKFIDNSTNFTFNVNGKVNKQYTISIKMYRDPSQVGKRLNIKFIYSDGSIKTYNIDSGNLASYTTEVGKTLTKITGTHNHSLNCYIDLECTQLEEGTQASIYEPYKCDKKDILIKEPLRENDYLCEDNGQVKIYRDVRQYTFTGDEIGWGLLDVKENIGMFKLPFNEAKGDFYNPFLICNTFNVVSQVENENPRKEGISINITPDLLIYINLNKLETHNIEGLKKWLKANPTTILYKTAAPTVEIVENCVDIDLDTYQGKTYFSILNSLPGTLDFKVPSNIASIVQANSKAINEIYDLIDKLILPNILQNTTDIEMLKLEKLK